jgi:hypothetical protein
MDTRIESESSPKRLARVAGGCYLLVGITGGFAEGFADPKLYVAGNAADTAANVLANVGLVRMSVVAHLVDAVFFVLTAMALYEPTGPTLHQILAAPELSQFLGWIQLQ